MRLIVRKFLLITMVALYLPCSNASSKSVTTDDVVTLRLEVVSACTMSIKDLNFGNYNLAELKAITVINMTCTNGLPYQIGLDAGTGPKATVATRKMTYGSHTLDYSLYDGNTGKVWGDTKDVDTVSGKGTGSNQAITIYGKMPESKYSTVSGTYTDTIVATVYFNFK